MMEFNLQLFGGRGGGYDAPSGSEGGHGKWSKGAGTKVADTLKEALGEKGKPIKMQKAYEDANPNHDKTYTYNEYNSNCQRCVVAYEMRRRGYDVTAQPTYEGDSWPRITGAKGWGRWQGAFRGARVENVSGKNPSTVVKNIQNKMKAYGNGSRGVVRVWYKGRDFGHVFNVEQRGNTTYFIDAQSGERLRANNFFSLVRTGDVTLTRTDNLRISNRSREFVTSESIYKRRRK